MQINQYSQCRGDWRWLVFMREIVGIIPHRYPNQYFLSELKQSVLLFDRIGVNSLDLITQNRSEIASIHHSSGTILPFGGYSSAVSPFEELRRLQSLGIIFNQAANMPVEIRDDIKREDVVRQFEEFINVMYQGGNINADIQARLICWNHNISPEGSKALFVPLTEDIRPKLTSTPQSEVYKVVLNKIPVPSADTSWDKIIDYKSNPQNRGTLMTLRRWISKMGSSNASIPEIDEELEHLLYQYEQSLRIHKIRADVGIFQSIIVGSAEFAEKVLKLQFGELAKGLFTLRKAKADLMEAELKSPGAELAYIYKTQQKF